MVVIMVGLVDIESGVIFSNSEQFLVYVVPECRVKDRATVFRW